MMVQLTCKNVGMIETAQLNVNGLTVIAGENDAGKSTLGKLLFALVKSFDNSDVQKLIEERRMSRIQKAVDRLYFTLRMGMDNVEKNILNDLLEYMDVTVLRKVNEISKISISNERILLLRDLFEQKVPAHLEKMNIFLTPEKKELYNAAYNELVSVIENDKESRMDILVDKFDRYLISLFENEVKNKFANNDNSIHIGLKEGSVEILDIVLNERQRSFSLAAQLYFNDAIFIESPTILHLSSLIQHASTIIDRRPYDLNMMVDTPTVSAHIKDLIIKLRQPNISGYFEDDFIAQIINGQMNYNENEMDFIYKKSDQEFKAVNIAAGIKSFGILQMLTKKGFVKERTLLILDEPEINLHPKWQIQYAEMLVKLAIKTKVSILLTSHSPYFIEAIKVFSDKYKFSDKTSFYLSEKDKTHPVTRIVDVTHDLGRVFEALTEPFNDLENETLGDWS